MVSNVQHSSETGEWYTPPYWVEAAREALGSIDLDPCTSEAANTVVKAVHCITAYQDPFGVVWNKLARTAFVNPPGACPKVGGVFSVCGNGGRCSCKLPQRFVQKSLYEAAHGLDVVYLAYSVNQLRQITNAKKPAGVSVLIAVPGARIPYIDPGTMQPKRGTNCDSLFCCFSHHRSALARFRSAFSSRGCSVYLLECGPR